MVKHSSDLELGAYSTSVESNDEPPPSYYSPLDCKGGKCNPINCALHPLAMHSVWQAREKEEQTQPWKIPEKVEIELFLGSGQLDHQFTTSHEEFARRCKNIEFSTDFLRNLRGKQPLYECKIHQSKEKKPTVLELAMTVYETDAIFIVVRYNITAQVLKGLIFFKQLDAISTCPLTFDSIIPFLDERRDEIEDDPLTLLPTLLSFLQFRSHHPVRWRVSLLKAEGWLGVTRRRAFLDAKGYTSVDGNFVFLNAHLASLAHELDDTAAAASSIQLLLAQVGKVVRICEGVERCPSKAELMTECKAVNAQLYVLQVKMSAANMQTLKTALYNRMGTAENQTAKSIAVIGLVFLPTMLVGSVFSTGIFNLQGTYSAGGGQVVSKFWPLFVLLCVGLTALMLGLWVAWERCGNRWLEKLGGMEVQNRWQKERRVHYVPSEIELREKQLSKSEESLAQLPKWERKQRSICSDGYYCIEHSKEHLFW